MKLSEVAFDDIKIGMRVRHNIPAIGAGKVVGKRIQEESGIHNNERNLIYIQWEHECAATCMWHSWCSSIIIENLNTYMRVEMAQQLNKMFKDISPEEVKLFLTEVKSIQEDVIDKFLETKNYMYEQHSR